MDIEATPVAKDIWHIVGQSEFWVVAIELVAHTSTDQYGNTVDEEGKFGMKQNIRITHPSNIMFANESGFSTSQRKMAM